MTRHILVMWSGGIDSTANLWHLLEQGCHVHAHHIHMVNKEGEGRDIAEWRAVLRMRDWLCARGYDFGFTDNTASFGFLERCPVDADICSFTAAQIILASSEVYVAVALGMSASDIASGAMMERAGAIFDAALGERRAVKIYPLRHLTKRQAWDSMPEELRRMTWTCRRPVWSESEMPTHCGECHACRLNLKQKVGPYAVDRTGPGLLVGADAAQVAQ